MARFTVAAIQMHSGPDKSANLAQAGELIQQAAERGARLIVLPELFNCLGQWSQILAEAEPLGGPTSVWLADMARRHQAWLIGGSICERAADAPRAYNTCQVFSPAGEAVAVYRKMHLFDVSLPGRPPHRESQWLLPGESVTRLHTPLAELGLAICYDLRFGELFAALAGSQLLAIPAAFTRVTGSAHWELLVRARAVENQAFVIAANQGGEHDSQLPPTFGHSMIVDPWGEVLAIAANELPAAITAEVDLQRLDEIRARLPALAHRRRWT